MNTCKLDYCDRKVVTKGYCKGHYEQKRNGKPFAPFRVHIPWERRLSDEKKVREAVESSQSLGRALDKLEISRGGKTYRALEQACEAFGIDCTFPEKYQTQRTPFEEVFIENSPYTNNRINLKKWLLEAGVLENKCVLCGQGPVWNDKPIVLQLDHINGVNNDHRVENLRILCPNCHTQTETYAGKARRND